MGDHDHLIPLPEPTPHNMWRIFAGGFWLGVTVMLADVVITNGLLGFENGYVTYAMFCATIFLITGAFKDNSVPMIMSSIVGIVIGALSLNLLRVLAFGKPSLLAGVGL